MLRTKGFIVLVLVAGLVIAGGAMYNAHKDKETVPIENVEPTVDSGGGVEYDVVVKEIEASHEEVLTDVEAIVTTTVEPSDSSGRVSSDTATSSIGTTVDKQGE
jgi:hypothetical protein